MPTYRIVGHLGKWGMRKTTRSWETTRPRKRAFEAVLGPASNGDQTRAASDHFG